MEVFEILSESCKVCWKENYDISGKKYTQVSGYIFNHRNQLLIVKNGNIWTIPGGHPETNETPINTLTREIMEEACLSVNDEKYIGAVEVIEDGETYYQLRYVAKAEDVFEFVSEWETSERLFVNLDELPEYIKWANGKTFVAQLNSAKKAMNLSD